jgi:GntR family transcriptional regulator
MPREEALLPGTLLAGPLYAEVKRRLTRSLSDGEWPPGRPLPSEAELARRYGVSIGTVRKGISELVTERVLVRRPGRGTFVATHDRDHMLEKFFNIVDEQGVKEFPAVQLLGFRAIKADAGVARRLRIATGSRVFQVENLLSLRDKPVIYDRIWISGAVMKDLDESIFRNRGRTIFGLYQSRYGVTVTRLEEWIRAAHAETKVVAALHVPSGSALLAIERVAYAYDDTPVEFRERYVDTRHHRYLNVLGMRSL